MTTSDPNSTRGHRLDVVAGDASSGEADTIRPFIGVWFSCANRYVRVLRDVRKREYTARCPQCGLTKRFIVAPGGEDRRLFELTCRSGS